ncbi:MAG: M67 family metallopeptidase [Actinomycetota bacterium]
MVELPASFYEEIVQHGLQEFPNEACGLIAAKEGVPVKVFRMRNADASPVSYRLDPKEQLQVFNEIDEEGKELYGIFHSHTHSEAYPSETDRRQAFYPGSKYLLLGLSDRDKPVLRAFTIEDGEIAEEELRIA